jgi:hypothetical protein
MKRALISLLALLALAMPQAARAQSRTYNYNDYSNSLDDELGPPPYNDVDNGQLLQLASYVLAPFGYALEWTVTRPMHHLATDTPLAPALSGDTEIRYFGETNNADMLPQSTFAPFQMPANPNAIDSSTASSSTYYQQSTRSVPAVTKSQRYETQGYIPGSGGQSAFH